MWGKLKSHLSPGSNDNPATPTSYPATPPSPVRYHWNGFTYAISANISPSHHLRHSPAEQGQELYNKTRSQAIAHYCLFGHDVTRDIQDLRRLEGMEFRLLDEPSRDYSGVRLRLKRCSSV